METVLIDTFIVPTEAKAIFLERARQAQAFIKTLPGFVEGFLYEQQDDTGAQMSIITTAVWKSEQALADAKRAVAEHNQRQGIRLQELRDQLGITQTRAIYQRSRY